MAASSMASPGEAAEPGPESGQAAEARVDLEALAERIYRLLKEEARLERERLAVSRIR